ncbi:MAG: transporter [Pseudonocardiales bacterium]|nr:transporter [Pseudonocardiales bacterium]
MSVVWGVLLATSVVGFSSTGVASSLPRIVGDLKGSQTAYSWVFSITILAATVVTPMWGKFADIFSRKLLLQAAILTFTLGSALAGLSTNTSMLIGFRVIQGIGVGGVFTLCVIVLSDLCSARDRGKYIGMLGAAQSTATLAGPLVGGLITDSPLGWRWNFYIGVPVAALALTVLQRTLHLPARPITGRRITIDYRGSFLIGAGVTTLLVWVSFAGVSYGWVSIDTLVIAGAGIALLVGAWFAERAAPDPVIPLSLFRNRTVVLTIIGSTAVGVAMFGCGLFLSQYLQIARARTTTESSLLNVPTVIGSIVMSLVVGNLITRTGKYKRWMILGALAMLVGTIGMAAVTISTSFILIGVCLVLIGSGVGALQQNFVLAAQNAVSAAEMATTTSTVSFFRMMGGSAGVSIMGAILAARVGGLIESDLRDRGLPADLVDTRRVPELADLAQPARDIVQQAYANGVAHLFLLSAVLAAIGLITVFLIREVPLARKTGQHLRKDEELEDAPAAG